MPVEFLAAEEALATRAEALSPVEASLNRALKRRLADEQNELLDLLRRSGATTADTLLPELATQVGGYARLAAKHLPLRPRRRRGRRGARRTSMRASWPRGSAPHLVEPFRRRVRAVGLARSSDAEELDERLRALYREWKAQHIAARRRGRAAAYALGSLPAAEPDRRCAGWSTRQGGPAPTCEDNALAGDVPSRRGRSRPAHACPPAHPGCRCLLVAD